MKKLNLILFTGVLASLFACTTQPPKPVKTRFLKNDITQAELNNAIDYKRYHYRCKNTETGSTSCLTSYFPLLVESRKKENFGFYFQLDGGKAQPFDHIENSSLIREIHILNVTYRSTTRFKVLTLI